MAFTSTFLDAMIAVRDRVRALNLPGLDNSDVQVRKLPTDGEQFYRGITIHPVRERIGRGVNDRDDIGYGVAITFVQNDPGEWVEHMDRWLHWREKVRQDFINDSCVTGIEVVFHVRVEPGTVYSEKDILRRDYDIGTMVLRCWVREGRT